MAKWITGYGGGMALLGGGFLMGGFSVLDYVVGNLVPRAFKINVILAGLWLIVGVIVVKSTWEAARIREVPDLKALLKEE